MKALVTGAGGFLGGAIARTLRDRRDEVKSFSRGAHPELAVHGIEHHLGDVADLGAVMDATRGVDIVFHTAARVGAGGQYVDFYDTNVTGTANVLTACRESHVPALVYTSTPSVVSGVTDLEGVDESEGYATHHQGDYGRTKAEAERLVLSSTSDEFSAVALRPPLIWGPGDTSLLPRVIERGRNGALRRIKGPPKWQDTTYIDDAVQAHLIAADLLLAGGDGARRINGRPYFVSSGEPVEIWDFVDGLLEAAGVPPVRKSVSPADRASGGLDLREGPCTVGSGGRSTHEPLDRASTHELTLVRHQRGTAGSRIRAAGVSGGWDAPPEGMDRGAGKGATWLSPGAPLKSGTLPLTTSSTFGASILRSGRMTGRSSAPTKPRPPNGSSLRKSGTRRPPPGLTCARILARYLGTHPQDVKFAYGEHGKPMLAEQNEPDFNLSHSESRGLAAVTWGARVGVDVEFAREGRAFTDIADRFFSQAESAELRALPPEARRRRVLQSLDSKRSLPESLGHRTELRLGSLHARLRWRRSREPFGHRDAGGRLVPLALQGRRARPGLHGCDLLRGPRPADSLVGHLRRDRASRGVLHAPGFRASGHHPGSFGTALSDHAILIHVQDIELAVTIGEFQLDGAGQLRRT